VATITFPAEPLVAGSQSLAAPLIIAALVLLVLVLAAGMAASRFRRHHRVLVRPA